MLLLSEDHSSRTALRPVGHLPDRNADAQDGHSANASSPGADVVRVSGGGSGGSHGPCVGELALVPPMIGGSQVRASERRNDIAYQHAFCCAAQSCASNGLRVLGDLQSHVGCLPLDLQQGCSISACEYRSNVPLCIGS